MENLNLQEMMVPVVVVACLILGYIMKKWLPTDNKIIPTSLALIGAVLGCIATKDITLTAIVGGALSGLASTGLHQAFKQFLDKEDGNE